MTEYSYEKKMDVLIIGGGVIGCSIAYFLARESRGKLKVGVIERNTVGEESSLGAAGMLAAQIESTAPGPFLDLSLRSREMFKDLYKEFKELCGIDIEYVSNGILSVAFDSEQEKELRKKYEWQKKSGLPCEWLSADSVEEKIPFFKRKYLGGFWVPQDGQVSSNRLVTAFSEGAKKMGVTFFENESFDQVDLKNPRLESLETNVSKFTADKFIFAVGAWTEKLLNGTVNVGPVKGQVLIYEMPSKWRDEYPWDVPVFCGTTTGPQSVRCYCVPKKDGHVWVGATMESRGMDKSENREATKEISDYITKIFPEISTFPFKGVWVGLRPAAPDRMPVMGLIPGSQNVYAASGHFRNGILLAPITGKIFADLVLNGKSSVPIESFSAERFQTKITARI